MGLNSQEAIKILKANYPTPNYSELREAVDMALALIREQEPMKPIRTPETIRAEYNCGNCTVKVGIKFYDGFWYFKAQYCPACGRKVKWDEQAD